MKDKGAKIYSQRIVKMIDIVQIFLTDIKAASEKKRVYIIPLKGEIKWGYEK